MLLDGARNEGAPKAETPPRWTVGNLAAGKVKNLTTLFSGSLPTKRTPCLVFFFFFMLMDSDCIVLHPLTFWKKFVHTNFVAVFCYLSSGVKFLLLVFSCAMRFITDSSLSATRAGVNLLGLFTPFLLLSIFYTVPMHKKFFDKMVFIAKRTRKTLTYSIILK